MGVYQLGTAVSITETFSLLGVPTSPTTVTFTIQDPNGTETIYTNGDPELLNPSPGVYILQLPALTVPGKWLYMVAGTGTVIAVGQGEFTMLQSAIDPGAVTGPQPGPCTPWIDCGDIQEQCDTTDLALLDGIAQAAGSVLFQLSGRQFSGRCEQTVRPHSDSCGCWPYNLLPGLSPGAPQYPAGAGGWGPWGWWGTGWGWGGADCGCASVSSALLVGYPVREVTEVKIDGDVIDPGEYRLDEWRWLTRLDDADGNLQRWPGCQDLARPDTEVGTWSATYFYGQDVPIEGKYAAQQLACDIYASLNGGACKTPERTIQQTRQGVTVQMAPFVSWGRKDGQWATGLTLVDLFLSAQNPSGLRRRPTIWSPDGVRYPSIIGS